MKHLIKKISSILSLSLALTALVGVSALAWGPQRTTYTMQKPSDHATFNSITNSSSIGDERNFVTIREAGVGKYGDVVKVVPGKEYQVNIYYHNGASETLNDKAHDRKGVAFNTRMSSQFPAKIEKGKRAMVSGSISSTSTNPAKVWDEAYMVADQDVKLSYKAGSAIIHNNWKTNGRALPNGLFSTEGTFIGMNDLDGMVFGCDKFAGYVTYSLIAEKEGITLDKTVSKDGRTYKENENVKPGDTIYYKTLIRNSGNVALNNVMVWDSLPQGISLIPGTVNNGSAVIADSFVGAGINLGTLQPGQEVTIVFQAKVSEDYLEKTAKCGSNKLVNTVHVKYDGGACNGGTSTGKPNEGAGQGQKGDCGSDTAVVTLEKDCGDKCKEDPNAEGCKNENGGGTATSLPKSGPAEVIIGSIAALTLIAGSSYWVYSRRTLKKTLADVKGGAGKLGGTPIKPAN